MTQPIQPHYRITFDPDAGLDPVVVPSPAEASTSAAIRAHLKSAGFADGAFAVLVDVKAGTVDVETANGSTVRATITLVAPDDYWTGIAAELHTAADQLATLAGTPAPAGNTWLSIYAGTYVHGADAARPIVDAVAAAIGADPAAETKVGVGYSTWYYEASKKPKSGLRIDVKALIPAPTDPRDAEIERLRAELAAATGQAMSGGDQ